MKQYFTFFIIALVLNSCASTMLVNKSIKPNEVQNISYYEPISIISLIQKGNQTKINDSLSIISSQILESVIKNSNHPVVSNKISLEDAQLKTRLENDILKTVGTIRKSRKLENIKTTSLMDSIVKNQNQRFALCIINTGFDRRKNNYGNQIAKGVGVGILTLGMYTPVPIKANTSLYAMIYDAETSSISYFNYFPIVEKSPTDEKNLNNLYKKLFEPYYKSSQN